MSKIFTTAADGHALDMANKNYFSHDSQDGRSFSTRITDAGYSWSAAGENIAAGYSTVQSVIDGWLSSPGHCANLMNGRFKDIGMARLARELVPNLPIHASTQMTVTSAAGATRGRTTRPRRKTEALLPSSLILGAAFGYLCLLFAIAYWGDQRADSGRSVVASPYVYALSIAVYCTAWTFYGSVGRAASSGGRLASWIGVGAAYPAAASADRYRSPSGDRIGAHASCRSGSSSGQR